MLIFESFTGINNVLKENRQSETDLVEARNVDIGLSGEITRRDGFTQVSEECHKNLWDGEGFMLATNGAQLVAIHSDGSRVVLHPALGPSRVWYCNLPDGRTTFSNGLIHGITDGATSLDRCIPVPNSGGSADGIAGALSSGQYRYALSYTRLADNMEGVTEIVGSMQLQLGGLRLDGLPARDGFALNVYLSGADGEGQYLAGQTLTRSFEFVGANHELVNPSRTLGAQSFPMGTVTAFWRGRVLVAVGSTLWASRPWAPHLCDWNAFRQFPAPITALQPVTGGIFVGTEHDLVFLGGEAFETLTYRETRRGPVVLGSGVKAPGDKIRVGDGAGAGEAIVCIAGGYVVAGLSDGSTTSLSGSRYKTQAKEVWAAFREVNEIPQYVALPK